MRKSLKALGRALALAAALSLAALPAEAAGTLVQRTIQDGTGAHTTYFLDMSGTGVGPLVPAYVAIDGSGNIGGVFDPNNAAFQGAVAMTVGTVYAAGRSLAVNASVAGNVSVTFPDASTLVFPVVVGFQTFPFAVTEVNSSGTTATATYANLK